LTFRVAAAVAVTLPALWPASALGDEPATADAVVDWSDVYICAEIRLDGRCDRRAALAIESEAAANPAATSGTQGDPAHGRRVAAWIQHGPVVPDRKPHLENGRAPMENGVETDPSLKWEVRHEFLMILAEAADRPALRTFVSRYQLKPDVEQVRAMRATYELERQRRRATYPEVEEELGSERVSGMTTGAFIAGTTLFTGAAALTAMSDSAPANTPHAKIRPKFGTPGIKLKGQFGFF
jgi:hypothetical protein